MPVDPGSRSSSAFGTKAIKLCLAGCGKTHGQAECLPHHDMQTVDPCWWRTRFRLQIGATRAFFRSLLVAATFLCLTGPLDAQDDARALLQRVRQSVMKTVDGLPKYVCTQTIDRAHYEPDSSHFVPINNQHRIRSCDSLAAEVNSPSWKRRLSTSDRLRVDVAVTHGRPGGDSEMYSWAGADRFSDQDLFQMVHDGAVSTGSFSSMLASIFGGDATTFSYSGNSTTVGGRLLAEFGFRVPIDQSHYSYVFRTNQERRVTIEYWGTIVADPSTSDLVRLVIGASQLPAESSSCEITQTLDYTRVMLNGGEFLLPAVAQITSLHTDGSQAENVIHYSACHEYRGDSAVQYHLNPEAGTAHPSEPSSSNLPLPSGLPFKLVITDRIDTTKAAAGDQIQAKLETPIRDQNRIWVPEEAVVSARIVSIRHFYEPSKVPGSEDRVSRVERASLTMRVKLESVQFGGRSYPITARPDAAVNQVSRVRGKLGRRIEIGTADRLDQSDEAVFAFFDPNLSRIVTKGLESNWVTAN